jgi:branched-chain amino acid transport system ATP-binding protein
MALLEVRDVSVRFGGNTALHDVDLDVEAGTVTGLIGPNGAGKTTLFNVVTGLQEPTGGAVHLDGRDITRLAAHRRARLGIARTFQRLEVFGSLSARDNVLTAAEIRRSWSGDRRSDPRADTDRILELVGIDHVADERVDAMPTGLARLVELGRALATRPKVLLLDEPASGLDEAESEPFASLLLRLAEQGVAVLLVEHDVQLVMRVCAVVHVLDLGRILAVGSPAEIQSDEAVLEAYLGAGTAPVEP